MEEKSVSEPKVRWTTLRDLDCFQMGALSATINWRGFVFPARTGPGRANRRVMLLMVKAPNWQPQIAVEGVMGTIRILRPQVTVAETVAVAETALRITA